MPKKKKKKGSTPSASRVKGRTAARAAKKAKKTGSTPKGK